MEKALSRKSFMVNSHRNTITKDNRPKKTLQQEVRKINVVQQSKVTKIIKKIRSWFGGLFRRRNRNLTTTGFHIVKRYNKPHHRTQKVRRARILAKHNRNRS